MIVNVLAKKSAITQGLLFAHPVRSSTQTVYCCGMKANKSSKASVEETNFVRSKLLHLSHQKWHSAAEVGSTPVSHQSALKAASGARCFS